MTMTEVVSANQPESTLFDNHVAAFDTSQIIMRRTNQQTAKNWTREYHYSATAGGGGATYYGAFAPDMIGLVIIAQPTNRFGVAAKYGIETIPGNMEISRVAVHPEAPRNSASRIIAMACRQYHQQTGLEWLFSYADTGQGHHGGIYQALNSIYVGISPPLPGYLIDGKAIHPRTVVSRFGTQAWPRVRNLAAAMGNELVKVPDMNTAKHTYILPIGNRRTQKSIRRALEQHVKPYPKRDAQNLGDDSADISQPEGYPE